MVLPPEMIMATIRGDLGALQTFLDQHPERVDDVADEADPMAHRTMSQIAIMCLAAGPSRGVSAPQALQIMRFLLSRGANPNHGGEPHAPTLSLLAETCINVWSEGVELLLQAGADPNLMCGQDPASSSNGQTHALALLLSTSWLSNDPEGRTPVEVVRDMRKCVELLLRNGAPLDFSFSGEICSLESQILAMSYNGDDAASVNAALGGVLDLAKAVRAAQSTSTSTRLTPWQKYCLVPPKELLRLRSQIARGKVVATRSTPPHLARLFSRSLPNEIAWRVLAFWNPRY